jgi:hypothetical protein
MEDTVMDGYWITEARTYKIFAKSEDEARGIWHRYWHDGEDMSLLDMKFKETEIECDWDWIGPGDD